MVIFHSYVELPEGKQMIWFPSIIPLLFDFRAKGETCTWLQDASMTRIVKEIVPLGAKGFSPNTVWADTKNDWLVPTQL